MGLFTFIFLKCEKFSLKPSNFTKKFLIVVVMSQKSCCYVMKKELERNCKSFVKNYSQKAKLKSTKTNNFKLIYFFVFLVITISLPQVSFINIITKMRIIFIIVNILEN